MAMLRSIVAKIWKLVPEAFMATIFVYSELISFIKDKKQSSKWQRR
jgi:hypothetical protein